MITFWQQENNKLIHLEKEELDLGKKTWIDARSVTRDDIKILEQEYHVSQEHILDILDQDEMSRIEPDDEYTLFIFRLPLFNPENDVTYLTIPLGIVLFSDKIITICWTDCEVLKDVSSNRIKNISIENFLTFILKIMSRTDSNFLRYLKEINRRTITIQGELQMSVKNNELIQLFNLEKSLEYFTTSLKSNQLLIEKLSKMKGIYLDEDQKDFLEDIAIDNRQAIEMTDIYSNILSGMMDAFASVISNNLNIVMKRLTVVSLVLNVPTLIVSFFGMNIQLPFANSGWIGTICVSSICLVATFLASLILKEKPVREKRKKKKKTKVKAI
ncbi:MAG: magnesium transporter CorA family protein [Spirochaetaceae bacterium]|nr:magnesium transporter CorA family protein [Spirochaetaceae bacterium]